MKPQIYRLFGISSLLVSISLIDNSASAQITATPNDANTVVNQSGNTLNINGGTQTGKNLFHSFEKFGVTEGQTVNFISKPEIKNILGRVTGSDASLVNGLIKVTGSNANLYLMNPAGIIFGSGARLDIPGSFTATTASGIGFGDKWLNAFGTNSYADLVGEPNFFAFTVSQPGAIFNAGNLEVGEGETLNLLGGNVINTGTLKSEAGNINIAAIPGEKLVRITQEGSLLSLGLPTSTESKLNPVTFTPLSLPKLLTGGNLNSATGVTVENGVIKLTGSGVEIPNDVGIAIVSGNVNVSGSRNGNIKLESSSGNLTLLGTKLSSSGNIEVRSLNQVKLLETGGETDKPLIVEAEGNININGNGGIEITAFENPDSILRSGGDFNLVSNTNIIGNARISTEGNFNAGSGSLTQSALSLNGIISSNGDINFGDYTGSSLKIEAKGSIEGGNINIDEAGAFPQIADPDIAILNANPSLILRAGVTELLNPSQSADLGNTSFTSTENPSLPSNIKLGNIEVGGSINISTTNGSVTTGAITGGSVDISSKGDIATAGIRTPNIENCCVNRHTGNVNLTSSSGKITVDFINASSLQDQLQGDVTVKAYDVFKVRSFTSEFDFARNIGASNGRIPDIPASIISNGKVSIEHGGESFIEGIGLQKDTNGDILYTISASSDEEIVGKRVFLERDAETPGFLGLRFVFKSGEPVPFSNADVSINTITPFNADDISENVSYTVGGIFITGGANSYLYGSLSDKELSTDISVVAVPKPQPPKPSELSKPQQIKETEAQTAQRQLNRDNKNKICSPENSNIALNSEANTRNVSSNNNPCKIDNDKDNILKVIPDNRFNSNSALPTSLSELGEKL